MASELSVLAKCAVIGPSSHASTLSFADVVRAAVKKPSPMFVLSSDGTSAESPSAALGITGEEEDELEPELAHEWNSAFKTDDRAGAFPLLRRADVAETRIMGEQLALGVPLSGL